MPLAQLPGWIVLLPSLLAVIIAIWRRNIILALLIGLWLAETLLQNLDPMRGFWAIFIRIIEVFEDPGRTHILLFSLLVGALLALFRASGGISAFTQSLIDVGFARTRRRAAMLPSLTGCAIFIETNLSILTAGIISQKLFDKFKMSRAQLAYIIDSTCSPISVLILLNGWGAYILGLIQGYGLENCTQTLLQSIGFNFYALLAVFMVFFTAVTGKVFGPMKTSTHSTMSHLSHAAQDIAPSRSIYFLLPIIVMVISMPLFMFYTGQGVFLNGSGSLSVLLAVCAALCVCTLLILYDKQMPVKAIAISYVKGMRDLLPLVTIVLLSMALGIASIALGVGEYVTNFVGPFLPAIWVAPILFICAGLIAFATGTSWGTFAIMIPIGLPMAMMLGVPPALCLAAILGGGVFGDHCSPISDSTLMSSLASGCDHLEHVRTQLPYALAMAMLSILLYLLAGWLVI